MMKTIVCVFLAFAAISIGHVKSQCPEINVCKPADPVSDTSYCEGVLSYIACLKEKILDEASCPANLVTFANTQVEMERNNMRQVNVCADYECPLKDCSFPMAAGNDMCTPITEWLLCLKSGVMYDKCDAVYIGGAHNQLTLANQQLQSMGCAELPDCSFLVCDSLPNESDDDYCVKGKEFVTCLKSKIVNHARCDEYSKDLAKDLAANAEAGLEKEGCSELPACPVDVCPAIVTSTDDDDCEKRKEYINCLKSKIVNSAQCNENSKVAAKALVASTEEKLGEECDAAAGLVSTVTMCLVLSWIAYLLSN